MKYTPAELCNDIVVLLQTSTAQLLPKDQFWYQLRATQEPSRLGLTEPSLLFAALDTVLAPNNADEHRPWPVNVPYMLIHATFVRLPWKIAVSPPIWQNDIERAVDALRAAERRPHAVTDAEVLRYLYPAGSPPRFAAELVRLGMLYALSTDSFLHVRLAEHERNWQESIRLKVNLDLFAQPSRASMLDFSD